MKAVRIHEFGGPSVLRYEEAPTPEPASDQILIRVHAAGLDHLHAGSIGVAALTAWQALFDNGELRSGQRVLIHGGGGGVGHYAVQFAAAAGAQVVATANAKDLEFVRSLGAKEVIDYKT